MNTLAFLNSVKHSPIGNYGGIPGLTSWLIGQPGPHGLVRLMECSRNHAEPIIPHSHRFNFHCLVLSGLVKNVLWEATMQEDEKSDCFETTFLKYSGKPGEYKNLQGNVGIWRAAQHIYKAGDTYDMESQEIHSIFFSKGTSVLFFEGPQVTDTSVILQPYAYGEVVPTFDVKPWMFKELTCPF